MLVSLSKLLKDDEFRTMKFLCSEFIKKREMESVENTMDLWENLESKEKIGPNNLIFLKELLNNACSGRLDVFRIVEEYENNSRNSDISAQRKNPAIYHQTPMNTPANMQRTSPVTNLRGMKREIDILTQHLGREWRFFMRALGLSDREMVDIEEDCPRNMREQIYRCLVFWASDDRHNASKEKIINALRDSCVERNDVVCLLNAK